MKTKILTALLLLSAAVFAAPPLRVLKREGRGSLTYIAYRQTGERALLDARYLSGPTAPASVNAVAVPRGIRASSVVPKFIP